MIEWGKVPWTLWALAVASVAGVVLIEVEAHGPVLVEVLFPIVMLTWLYFLLRGVRWVWIVTLAISTLGYLPDLISGSLTWEGVAGGVVTVVLLLLPTTRRFYAREPEPTTS